MSRDLDDLLAEGAPRDPGTPDLAAIESRASRRRTGRVGATVAAVLAATALAVQALPSLPDTPIVDEGEGVLLPTDARTFELPAPGGAAAVHVGDRPALVVHEEDGDLHVLDGISPHAPSGLQKALAWCVPGGFVEDVWHGSKFAPNGAWIGGPAPTGLAAYEVLQRTSTTVTVGALGAPPARTDRLAPDGYEITGGCGEVGHDTPDLDDLVRHEPQHPDVVYVTEEAIADYPASLREAIAALSP